MNLEDHLGDIIRKARAMTNVSVSTAAVAAGLSVAEFRALERTGQCATKPNLAALAGAVGLHAAKLKAIANGWLPMQPDLSRWRELRVITTNDGEMSVNCFLVWDEANKDAALFDTGFEAGPILEIIAENRLQLGQIFITHSHSDHIACLADLQRRFPGANLSAKGVLPQRHKPQDSFISLGHLRITQRETPGHADDGVTYIVGNWQGGAAQVAVVGDALFAGSMGGAVDSKLARQKVREEILSLPGETLICPGHGPLTTVAEEMTQNPFF